MPPDLVLFLDENLHNCQAILHALGEAGVAYERHRDHFLPGTPDAEWISLVGDSGWALLTSDQHIRTRYLEREAVRSHGLAMFCFTGKVTGAAAMGASLRIAIPAMRALFVSQKPPFIAMVTKGGEVNLRHTF